MQLIYYIRILRPLNLLIATLCVLLCAFLMNQLDTSIIPLMLVISLLAGFANIINDIIDSQIDSANHLDRPIASNAIRILPAFTYSIILFV